MANNCSIQQILRFRAEIEQAIFPHTKKNLYNVLVSGSQNVFEQFYLDVYQVVLILLCDFTNILF